jgi:outer membrane protein, heavy metal efflux system
LGVVLSARISAADEQTSRANPPEHSWTPESLAQHGLRENVELKRYQAEVQAARGSRMERSQWKNPEITLRGAEKRTKDSAGTLEAEGYLAEFSLSQSFEFPGKASLRRAIANSDVRIAELGLQQFELTLQTEIKLKSIEYSLSQARASILKGVIEVNRDLYSMLKERPTTGPTGYLERQIIELATTSLTMEALDAHHQEEEARIKLLALAGMPHGSRIQVISMDLPPPLKREFHESASQSLVQNLEIKIRKEELAKAQTETSSAQIQPLPDFSIGPFFSRETASGREENIGGAITFSLPLWNFGAGGLQSARASKALALHQLKLTERTITDEIEHRLHAYSHNWSVFKELNPKSAAEIRELLEFADRQYRSGAIGLPLLMETQEQAIRALSVRNAMILELWQHYLTYLYLVGNPPPDHPPHP